LASSTTKTNSSPPRRAHEVVHADAGANAISDGDEQSVAVGVAQEVVHDLEAVEVDDEHGRVTTASRRSFSSRMRARRLGRSVKSSWRVVGRALFGLDAPWSWTSIEATAWSALISAGTQSVQPKCRNAEHPPRGVTEQQRHGRAVDQGEPRIPFLRDQELFGRVRQAGQVGLL
jgi:hypothetical protein